MTQAVVAMHRFILVPVRVDEDVALARYAVQAAHSETGAVLALDLTGLDPAAGVDAKALLEEFGRTAAGNAQRFVVVGPDAAPGVTRFGDLRECLAATVPLAGRGYEIEMTLPARVEPLAPLRQHLAGVVRELHGESDAFQVEILVDELCLNAVENSTSSRNAYDVRFRCEGHELQMEVTNVFDDSVDSERIMHRRLASFDDSGNYLGERGRGLFLVARIADGLQIRSLEADRIRVSVTKRLRGTREDG